MNDITAIRYIQTSIMAISTAFKTIVAITAILAITFKPVNTVAIASALFYRLVS